MTHGRAHEVEGAASQHDRTRAESADGRRERKLALQEAAGNQATAAFVNGAAPLAPRARETLERAYGVELGGVRVHAGPDASAEAHAEGALAFTSGGDVQLGSTHPDVIAHELAHVVQQAGPARDSGLPSQALEREAEQGDATPGAAAPGAVQRWTWPWEDEEKQQGPDETRKRQIANTLARDPEQWRQWRTAPEFWNVLEENPAIRQRVGQDPEYWKWAKDPEHYTPPASETSVINAREAEQQAAHPLPAPSKTPEKDWVSSFEQNAPLKARGQRAERKNARPSEFYSAYERKIDEPIPILELIPGGRLGRLVMELGAGAKVSGHRVDRVEKAKEVALEAAVTALQFVEPGAGSVEEESAQIGRSMTPELEQNIAERGLSLGPEVEPVGEVRQPNLTPEPATGADPAALELGPDPGPMELESNATPEAAPPSNPNAIELGPDPGPMELESNATPEAAPTSNPNAIEPGPETGPLELESNATPQGISQSAESRAVKFKQSSTVDPGRKPHGFETGRATRGRPVKAGGLEGYESHSFGGGRVRSGLQEKFMDDALEKIAADPNHPLRFLVDEEGNWLSRTHLSELPTVQAGHLKSFHSGAKEALALEDSFFNQLSNWKGETQGVIFEKSAVEIGGIPVELRTAKAWESAGLIPKGTVDDAVAHAGWTGAP